MKLPYESTDQFPQNTPGANGRRPKLWEMTESDDFKGLCLLHVMEDIRTMSPENMSDDACRAALGRLKAYMCLYDIGKRFESYVLSKEEKEELRAIT